MTISFSVNRPLVTSRKFLKTVYQGMFGDLSVATVTDDLRDLVDKELVSVLNEYVLPVIRDNLTKNKSVFTGSLYGGLEFLELEPGRIALDAKEANEYSLIVERGSRPRQIDSEEAVRILQWVIHRDSIEDVGLAKAVADKVIASIEEKGNIPHPYIEPAMLQMLPTVRSEMNQRLQQLIGA